MEMDSEDISSGVVNMNKLHIFMPVILKCVNAAELVPYLTDIISTDEKRAVRNRALNDSPQVATQYLIDILQRQETEKGQWRAFITALEEADYPFVSQILEGDAVYMDSNENQEKIIQCIAPEIKNKMIPKEILPDLKSKGIINQQDAEEVLSQEDRYGPIAGSMLLLDKIPRRVENWYELFLQVLFEFEDGKRRHVARMIDEDFVMKKELQLKENLIQDNEETKVLSVEGDSILKATVETSKELEEQSVLENYASASGPAQKHGNNLNAPSCVIDGNTDYDFASDMIAKIGSDFLQNSKDTTHCPTDNDQTKLKLTTDNANQNVDDSLTHRNLNFEHPEKEIKKAALPVCADDIAKEDRELDANEWVQKIKRGYGVILNDTVLQPNITEDEDINHGSENHNEENSDEEDAKDRVKKDLDKELRGYQFDLAKPAINGQNAIIVAPTGSGKTHVAMKIIQSHIEKMRGKKITKVILIVSNSALANQHYNTFQEYLSYNMKCITGETQRPEKIKSLCTWISKRDILIVTAQIWLNSLLQKDTSINSFTLVIFDECHHCTQKHAYNKIMEHYMDVKLSDEDDSVILPQIVGLTASVGIGKANDIKTAKEKITSLMSNLDVKVLQTVRNERSRQELSEWVKIPEEEIRPVSGRAKNLIGEWIEAMMGSLEKSIKSSECLKFLENKDKIVKIPVQHGGDLYTQWIGESLREIAKLNDKTAYQFFFVCRRYLDIFNRALIIYRDARAKDAFEFMSRELNSWQKQSPLNDLDSKMMTMFKESKPKFEKFIYDKNHENPKLKELEEMICEVYNKNGDMRGIVFVRTKELGVAIVQWMEETPILQDLKPVKFFGVQASSDAGGMTKTEQSSVLKKFRDGEHKLIVATTVAEEGLDISKCNLVIKYDHITNVIGMVQSRGRARASDSSYVTLAQKGHGTAEREELNILRENLMNNAIYALQDEISAKEKEFGDNLKQLQQRSKIKRDAEAAQRGGRNISEGVFILRCGKCSTFMCMSVDIRKILDSNHVVVCPDILKYIQITKSGKPSYSSPNGDFKCAVGKLHCRDCGNPIGNISLYESVPFPVLAVKNLRFEDEEGRFSDIAKKWKDAPFAVDDLTTDDLKKLVYATK